MFPFALLLVLVISSFYDLGSAVILECDNNVDCLAEDATCVDRICECPKGKTFSIDGTRCLEVAVGYGANCEEDTQCAWLLGKYTCTTGKCGCQSGYRYYHGKCVISSGLGQSCTKSEECHVSNDLNAMICSAGLCDCNEGYYARGHYDCRPIAKAEEDICAIDSDCQFDGGYCNSGKCATSGKALKLETTKTGSKQDQSKVAEEYTSPKLSIFDIGDSCNINDDCQEIENSYCSPITKQCMCKRGYYLNGTHCVGELGLDGGCSSASDCTLSGSTCLNNRCVCLVSHLHIATLNKCSKVSVSPDFFCTDDLGCQIMGSQAKCVEIGIFEKACECPFGTILNKDTNLCVADNDGCAADCTEDEDCSSIVNSVCNSSTAECHCPTNYRLEDDICLPNLGAACDHVNKKCEMENSECVESNNYNVCRCKSNYYQLDDTSCIKMAAVDEECSLDIQCSSLNANSECSGGKCKCLDNHLLLGGHCFAERSIGEYCINVQQCKSNEGSEIQCRNSICQCPSSMEPTEDKLNCIERSTGTNILMHYSSICMIVSIISFYLFN